MKLKSITNLGKEINIELVRERNQDYFVTNSYDTLANTQSIITDFNDFKSFILKGKFWFW